MAHCRNDLLALVVRYSLHQVGNLRGVQVPEPVERKAESCGWDMPDKRLDARPVNNRAWVDVSVRSTPQCLVQKVARMNINSNQPPRAILMTQDEVARTHDTSHLNVDEPASQNVLLQEDLARPAFEPAEVDGLSCQLDEMLTKPADLAHRDEYVATADVPLQADDKRMRISDPNDEVVYAAKSVTDL